MCSLKWLVEVHAAQRVRISINAEDQTLKLQAEQFTRKMRRAGIPVLRAAFFSAVHSTFSVNINMD
jgi:hypothetical protein